MNEFSYTLIILIILGIENLINLKQLDIQNNRLTSIGTTLLSLSNMAELYLACNAIESVCGLPQSAVLNTVDLSNNPISSLEGIQQVNTYVLKNVFYFLFLLSIISVLFTSIFFPRLSYISCTYYSCMLLLVTSSFLECLFFVIGLQLFPT